MLAAKRAIERVTVRGFPSRSVILMPNARLPGVACIGVAGSRPKYATSSAIPFHRLNSKPTEPTISAPMNHSTRQKSTSMRNAP